MYKFILSAAILITCLFACKKTENVVSHQEKFHPNVNAVSKPFVVFGIRIRIPRLKWDRPKLNCEAGFALCNPDKHQPVTFFVIPNHDTLAEGDFDLTYVDSNTVQMTFLNSYIDMGESTVPSIFHVDYSDDIVFSNDILNVLGLDHLEFIPGAYSTYWQDGYLKANINVISE